MKKAFLRTTAYTGCLAAALFIASCAPSERYLLRQQRQISSESSYVRVLVGKFRDAVVVSSEGKIKITDIRARTHKYYEGGGRISFRPESVKSPLEIESWNAPLSVNGTSYRGTIELHAVTGMLYAINPVKLDEYLLGVVPSEMPPGWPLEAMKSQAVAARTYAYYHIMKHKNLLYDLDATTNSQVYKGISAEKETSNHAVLSTAGEIITHKGSPILSYFHSTCGGHTIDDRHVWSQSDLPYLEGTGCPYCADSPKYSWDYRLGVGEIKSALRKQHPEIRSIKRISFKKLEGRIATVVVKHNAGTIKLTGNQFRMLISPYKIRSLSFEARKTKGALLLNGKGWGHGVGLCQYGAKGMAELGKDHRDILKHYYKDVDITRIDGSRPAVPDGSRDLARRTPKRIPAEADE
jgi:stage II sporulation protein D